MYLNVSSKHAYIRGCIHNSLISNDKTDERITCGVSCSIAIQGGSCKDSQNLDIVLDENQTWNSYGALLGKY